ncbi:glycerol-3-phosphate 1-O-acyltransferase PlsY [Thermanaerosceptrum fracticalcis]|uniref:Glycerol-3-phosphate acyltransferase n=1 Tax=Thermanaerosceptrum fracticalcis TaxID=1712410 RepID=A0A7G6E1E9_THEFR|nr:glycerol-3-phosphate 1-O-acyltransferase PlsY [Thermanaerosceptrum fracticalcis]QNB45903.1 glycerol-3-phosphate 1-O-acyltransferase PlsY [Thermanaerosceptrum fracticalcis]
MELFVAVISGYLVGSVSFGIILTKLLRGVDIRQYGSGNTGMTNVMRTIGKGPAMLVLLGDALKGAVSVGIGLSLGSTVYAVIAGLAAMAGHTYPLFHGFRGGRGVATGFGVILTLTPDVTLIALSIFLLTVFLSRYVSLGSILAALSVPLTMTILQKPLPILLFGVLGAGFVIYRHKANIKRLVNGTEYKVGEK